MKLKTDRQSELPRFVLGALATAGASVANAATVQITLVNNYVANTANGGGVNFNGDVTGDGVDDGLIYITDPNTAIMAVPSGLSASGRIAFGVGYAVLGAYGSEVGGSSRVSMRGVGPFSFTDARINNGLPTAGWLDHTATSGPDGQEVRLHRLIFDDESVIAPIGVTSGGIYTTWSGVSAVPEVSGSLALLALGAGGLLTRRRAKLTSR